MLCLTQESCTLRRIEVMYAREGKARCRDVCIETANEDESLQCLRMTKNVREGMRGG